MGFSEYLQKFMKTNSISMMDLSIETDIDRTVIYRYVKGTRIPSDIDVVVRIADALQMTVSEKGYLLKEYDKLILGEPMVYSYQYIQKLLHNLSQLDDTSNVVDSQWQIKREPKTNDTLIELKSKEEIVTYIMELFRYIAESENTEKILLVMQPIYEEIQQFLPQILKKESVEMEQIICMEQDTNQNYKNLDLLLGVLPICFSFAGYEVFYYYDALKNHINNMTYFPNILIMQDFVVQFDYEMRYGIVVKNHIYVTTVRRHYGLMRKETRRLMVREKNPKLIGDFLMRWDMKNCGIFFEHLCMVFCLDRQILEDSINPIQGKKEFIDVLLETRGEWKKEKFIKSKYMADDIVSYGSRKGLKEFMDTGYIKEFPKALYRPLSYEERMLVLERMIILVKEKRIRYYFLSDKVELPEGIQFCWDECKKRIALSRIMEDEILRVVIEEQSIYKTFRMYLKYLEKKKLIYDEKESLNYLIKIYKSSGKGMPVN